MYALKENPISDALELAELIREEENKYPRCEFIESSQCCGMAVCISHGIPCCEHHGKIRSDYYKD